LANHAAFPHPGREQVTTREGDKDKNNRQSKRGDRRAQHPRHCELQERIASLHWLDRALAKQFRSSNVASPVFPQPDTLKQAGSRAQRQILGRG